MKLSLGTVQLGMQYGIARDLRPSLSESLDILEYACQHGITTFDTANAYGDSENILGNFFKNHSTDRTAYFIVSKTPPKCLDNIPQKEYLSVLEHNLEESLGKLQCGYIDSYLFHTSSYAFDLEKLSALYELKKSANIKHCGISVYSPQEAVSAIESSLIDFVQLPFNLFDHRFYDSGVFKLAKEKNITVHVRSVFLQGLFAMDLNNIPPFLSEAVPPLAELNKICSAHHISKLELAMGFVKKFPEISHIVIGVNSLGQLKKNIDFFKTDIDDKLRQQVLLTFNNLDKNIYIPTLWRKS